MRSGVSQGVWACRSVGAWEGSELPELARVIIILEWSIYGFEVYKEGHCFC